MDDSFDRLDDEELSISRAIDGSATERDWQSLERIAIRDGELWERLSRTLRADAILRRHMDHALELAERCELPAGPLARRTSRRPYPFFAWCGWAAAALIAALWILPALAGTPAANAQRESRPAAALTSGEQDMARAWSRYLETGKAQGRIVTELPRLLVKTRLVPGGNQVEVLYMRRLLERARVDQLYQRGSNDQGEPIPVPVNSARLVGFEGF